MEPLPIEAPEAPSVGGTSEDGPATAPDSGDAPQSGAPRRLSVTLDLGSVLEHCKCSICMGIVKNTRAISACMHRFCKDCIEAWLRTQIENNCPQCRVKFSSKRDCKPDPNFDLLLGTMFGDIQEFEQQMLDPSAEVLERAKSVGQQIAAAAYRRPSPPPHLRLAQQPLGGSRQGSLREQSPAGHATVHVTAMRSAAKADVADTLPASADEPLAAGAAQPPRLHGGVSGKRPPPPGHGTDGKRLKLAGITTEYDDGSALQYRGVRFQGDNWQARTKRNGKELSLGLYNTAEEAGMAYDLDRLQQQGGKAQRLNFPLLRQHYKQILVDMADLYTPDGLLDFLAVTVQAAVKAARQVPGATAPRNTGPQAASVLGLRRPATSADALAERQQERLQPGAARRRPAFGWEDEEDEEDEEDDLEEDDDDEEYEEEEEEEEDAELEGALRGQLEVPVQPQAAAPPVDLQASARQRAERLAAERPLADGLSSGVAYVRLEPASGPSWQMTSLACPLSASVSQLAEAVALGLSQQHRLPLERVVVGLTVANDLDASVDFDALCSEDAVTGNLLLRGHVAIRELLGTLQDPAEDLVLEYFATVAAQPVLGTDAGGVRIAVHVGA